MTREPTDDRKRRDTHVRRMECIALSVYCIYAGLIAVHLMLCAIAPVFGRIARSIYLRIEYGRGPIVMSTWYARDLDAQFNGWTYLALCVILIIAAGIIFSRRVFRAAS